jgi:CTP:molybdopterin cytidylyltransferase MocA
MSTRGDRGARDLLREHAADVRIVPDDRLGVDVDRPEEMPDLL